MNEVYMHYLLSTVKIHILPPGLIFQMHFQNVAEFYIIIQRTVFVNAIGLRLNYDFEMYLCV